MTFSLRGYTKKEILGGVLAFTIINILLLYYLRESPVLDFGTLSTALIKGIVATLIWLIIIKKDLLRRKSKPTAKRVLIAILIGFAFLMILFLLMAAVAFIVINFP